jgi:MarR family 2-MHQ and catechol resistance regulon transcriptional repressor
LRVWVVLSRAYAAVQAHAVDDVTRHGLNLPEFGALEVLYHKGPLSSATCSARSSCRAAA